MAKKRRKAEGNWEGVSWGGYRAYRRGNKTAAPPPTRILRGEKRKHVLHKIMDVMRDWRWSPFEHEATCVHGLRSGFCLQGNGFRAAEAEAMALVGEAINLLGLKRPTWEQGQPDWTTIGENCSWCRRRLEDDDELGGRTRRYCSVECARAAALHKSFEARNLEDRAFAATYQALRAGRFAKRDCASCGKAFHPAGTRDHQRFCSSACWGDAQRKHERPERVCEGCGTVYTQKLGVHAGRFCSIACYDKTRAEQKVARQSRPCAQCGTHFMSKLETARFCSAVCRGEAKRAAPAVQIARACDWCGADFVARDARARCCCKACAGALARARAGIWPERMSPLMFDGVFKMAA